MRARSACHCVVSYRLEEYAHRHWHDLSNNAMVAMIRGISPAAPERATCQVWCFALFLRWTELAAAAKTPSPAGRRIRLGRATGTPIGSI